MFLASKKGSNSNTKFDIITHVDNFSNNFRRIRNAENRNSRGPPTPPSPSFHATKHRLSVTVILNHQKTSGHSRPAFTATNSHRQFAVATYGSAARRQRNNIPCDSIAFFQTPVRPSPVPVPVPLSALKFVSRSNKRKFGVAIWITFK